MASWVAAIVAIVMLVVVVSGAVITWLSKVSADLAEHKTHVAETYATKDDVKELGDRVERNMDSGFDRIYNLLQGNNAA
ncbi:hypothetical protein [Moritella viscosa]|uniref:Uncharacterized protein n=1 Tax=Moritella viscosa TaxID=80854 RepID=A0ABY1HMG4_9GAMM|nr:hypothetical protein [Moritella viscosa]SGY96150.1 Putative uncharacterized protein [Moritella viscosa]SGZ02217.1 Putative uncharacterized protein [Moritella viscosa]SHO06747.1 Putative uncharacterized protein [Moritella viscosa]SHO28076.1 Putative uncharacterized protein [Moritella viscosa]